MEAAGKKAPAPKAPEPAVLAAPAAPEPEFEVDVDIAAEAKIEAPDNTADAAAAGDTPTSESTPEDTGDAPPAGAQGVNVEPAPAAGPASEPEATVAHEAIAVADSATDAVTDAVDEAADAGADTETPPTDEVAAPTQAMRQNAAVPPIQTDAPENRLRTAMRNPTIVLASATAAALLLSAVGAYIVVRMHAAPRGQPPAEIHEIKAAVPATPQAPAENAAAHTPAVTSGQTTGHDGAESPGTNTYGESGHAAPATATDTHATPAAAGPPLTPQQTMEKQSVEIEALRQSLLQERSARAEAEKKFQLALAAASAPQAPEIRLPPPAPPAVANSAPPAREGVKESTKPQTLGERANRAELEKKNQLALEAAQALDAPLSPQPGPRPAQNDAIEARSPGTLQERAARAERDKKTRLALEASPVAAAAAEPSAAQVRKAGTTRAGTGRYLEDCTVVGKTLAETLRGCAAEFKQKK